MALFDRAIDYSADVFRNIRTIKESQHLFDDLSHDPIDWDAANIIDMQTHPELTNLSLIQRAFDYSKNDFIEYPFENITASRYSDGAIACWYGSESLATTIHETTWHFIEEIRSAWDVFAGQESITVDRRVARVNCRGLAFDLSGKAEKFPWLIDPVNYTRCQELGRRVAKEGHPLLRVPSARDLVGINLLAFNQSVLSNVREHCKLQYRLNLDTLKVDVYRGSEEISHRLSLQY